MQQDVFLAFVLALLIGSLNAYLAKNRGRSPVIWFFIGAFFGLLGLIALFLLPSFQQDASAQEKEISTPELIIKPLPPLANSWYYLDAQHTQVGPISLLDLERFYKERAIKASTYLWCAEMPEWKKLQSIATLESHLVYRAKGSE